MTPNIKKTSLFLFISILFLMACKREVDDHHHDSDTDHDKPVLVLTSPANLQMYTSGDTVKVHGLLTDASLHQLLIQLTNDSDTSVLFTESPAVHDLTSFTIDSKWKSQVSAHTNATLIVRAEDHGENVTADTLHIHIMP